MAEIEILLATRNGRTYLAQQLDSILCQTHTCWKLLVCDDGSTDGTRELLYEYIQTCPDRIRMVNSGPGRLGARGNFAFLLKHSTADYVAFCDQDDCWLPEKLALTLEKMQELEKACGTDTPLLVHSDLRVVNEQGRVLSPSFWRRQQLDPVHSEYLNRLLVQNGVTGCTAMINGRLRELGRTMPEAAIMHDWWLALAAAAFGKVAHIRRATVHYRQHAANVIGAPGYTLVYLLRRLNRPGEIRRSLLATQRQAAAFLDLFGALLTDGQKNLVRSYAEIRKEKFFMRKMRIFEFDLFKMGLLRNLAFLALV